MTSEPRQTSSRTARRKRERVAVIAVHGVADQKRGETAAGVGTLLARALAGATQAKDQLVHTSTIEAFRPEDARSDSSLYSRLRCSLSESWISGFLLQVARAGASPKAGRGDLDLGARYTDYLLSKSRPPTRRRQPTNVSVVRVDAPAVRADVFEVYWADLSRVGRGASRIFSELVTLLFRFGRLTTDALALAALQRSRKSLWLLSSLQRASEWTFSRMIGPAALQLLICLLILGPALVIERHREASFLAFAILVSVASASLLVYRCQVSWRVAAPASVLLGLGLHGSLDGDTQPVATAALDAWISAPSLLMLTWVASLALLYFNLLKRWEEAFRAALGMHLLFFACALGALLRFGTAVEWSATATPEARWISGSLGAFETILALSTYMWLGQALLLGFAALVYEWVTVRTDRTDRSLRQALVTARLGLFTSVGAFLITFMVGLKLVNWVLSPILESIPYAPHYFSASSAGESCTSAAAFLNDRANSSAAGFAAMAVVILVLLAFVSLTFAPAIATEMQDEATDEATQLGAWLTAGYRAIEGIVRPWGVIIALTGIAIALPHALHQMQRFEYPGGGDLPEWLPTSPKFLSHGGLGAASNEWLDALLFGIATGTVGLLALGRIALTGAKALRSPLDAALDVDNHFREFPRKAISRVRIMERYLAVLKHVRSQNYDRVIIVAHSQGTVITAELLRYLQQRASLDGVAEKDAELAQLGNWVRQHKLRLLTVGSPLRQLYALRFPDMYDWVLASHGEPGDEKCSGPSPSELGLASWSNLWGSGDYVGRWLWTHSDETTPQALDVEAKRYESTPLEGRDHSGARWKDLCIGGYAHTHYFDLEQDLVADELRTLVSANL